MRRTSLLIFLLLALPAAPANAKGVDSARLCGPDGCTEVEDHVALAGLEEGRPGPPPRAGAPWYRVEVRVRAGEDTERSRLVVVPAKNRLRGADPAIREYQWIVIPPDRAAALRREAAGLRPYPASKLAGTGPVPPAQVRHGEVVLPPDDTPAGAGLGWPAVAGIVVGLSALLAGGWRSRRRLRHAG